MAEINSPHDNIDMRINSKIQIFGHVLLIGSLFSSGIGVFFMALFTLTHFTQAVALSSIYIYGVSILLGLSLLGLVIGLWVKLVIVPGSRAYAYAVEARGQAKRNKLIHIQDNAAVIENERGNLEVVPLLTMQQRDIYHHKQDQPPLIEAPALDPLPSLVRYEQVKHKIPPGHALVGIGIGEELITRPDGVRALVWIVGSSGTGKTNSVVIRVEDDYAQGHKFLVIDPHMHKEDSLSNAITAYADHFLLPVAQTSEAILKVLDTFLAEFNRRKHIPPPYAPLTLIVDEVGSLTQDIDPDEPIEAEIKRKVKEVGRMCGQEGRGFGMHAMMISQDVAYLAWLRKRALLAIIHQLQDFEDRLRATNRDSGIARDMDSWPVGRTLCFGINFTPVVVQQPVVAQRSIVYANTHNDEMEPLPYKNSLEANGEVPGSNFALYHAHRGTSNLNNGSSPEANGEAAGSNFTTENTFDAASTKIFLLTLAKRMKNGESKDKILRSVDITGGRHYQDTKAVLDLLEKEQV